jgi:succinate dehydrogenase membrane anchor subunit
VDKPLSFESWQAWVAHPLANIALLLFIFSLLVHAWIGGRDVAMDYIKPVAIRYVLLIGFALSLLGLALWSLRIVLLVNGGSQAL